MDEPSVMDEPDCSKTPPPAILNIQDQETSYSPAETDISQPSSTASRTINEVTKEPIPNPAAHDTNMTDNDLNVPPTSDEQPPNKLTFHQKVTFLSAALATLGDTMAFAIMSPFFPLEAANRGISPTLVGFIFSAFSLTTFLASPIFGKIMPVVGARFLFLSGSFLAGGSNILFGFIDEIEDETTFLVFCFILRVVQGIGAAAGMTASAAIIAFSFPTNVGFAMSLTEMLAGVGSMLGPSIGGFLYSAGGFKLPFIVLGGIELGVVAVNICLMPEHGTESKKMGSLRAVLSIPAVCMLMAPIFLGSFMMGFLDPTLSPHLNELGLNVSDIGLVFFSFSAVYALSAAFWGYTADKTKATRIIIVMGTYLGAISLLLIGPSPLLNIPEHMNEAIILFSVELGAFSISMIVMPTFLAMLKSAE